MLLLPGSALDALWRLNPDAQTAFQSMGRLSILIMTMVGAACLFAAIGLARDRRWGGRLALLILVVNLVGDTANAIVRHDPRTLIGLPIGGAMIAYLATRKAKN